ncbi:unnamed protein product [Rotaria magnacalcarata]|uniref:AIG1-type G domain-containing protein n=2 Tax=Rotaria magnacalcarata TaxID=392030 RepID=A0A816BV24_9BILA|nr:unnamed protein product [Rotaria magnacalcarata]CAF1612315.1 unnamed protein product [Rotaria magnacalcarata]CAF2083960.1 unnamed protein product [Rotaria magnacalcarata]CAF3851716.1 unnamed protein product [Rotaria magnacalcarata]CAF4069660.1 unnamed protein product [Rotaria magnacalcarata]
MSAAKRNGSSLASRTQNQFDELRTSSSSNQASRPINTTEKYSPPQLPSEQTLDQRLLQPNTQNEFQRSNSNETSGFNTTGNIIRLVLLGKTGLGKSSLGNLLLGSTEAQHSFEALPTTQSVTDKCVVGQACVDNHELIIIDTPGFFDTRDKTAQQKKATRKEIAKSIQESAPGPHGFLIVLAVGRFTLEEQKSIVKIKKMFSPNVLKYCTAVFTGKERLDYARISIEQQIDKSEQNLKDFLKECGGGYTAVNNLETDPNKRKEMQQDVLQCVINMIKNNGNNHFTNATIKKVNVEILKINKEHMGRFKQKLESEAATLPFIPTIHTIEDEELLEPVHKIVEADLSAVMDENEDML